MLRDRLIREVTRHPATIDELAGRIGVPRAVVHGVLSDLCWKDKLVAPRADRDVVTGEESVRWAPATAEYVDRLRSIQ